MPLEDLIAKVKDEKRKDILSLEKEHRKAVAKMEQEYEEKIDQLKERFRKEKKEKKENILKNKEREESFNLKMKRLNLKKKLLKEAEKEALKEAENLSQSKKEALYLEKIKEAGDLMEEAKEIVVPKEKESEAKSILKKVGAEDKMKTGEVEFKDGFLIRGDKWSSTISLDSILNGMIEDNKKKFVKILFEDL